MQSLTSRLVFLGMVLHISCSPIKTITADRPLPYPTPPPYLIAGIAQSDLTPPPGYPMSGYSLNGRISRGYWIPPKATALYLQDETGKQFIFVTTDLWAISDGQKLRVLDLLSKDHKTNFIGENELLLAATHSHHSLGVNIPDASFAASSIGFGFDNEAFEYTARQIASAITMAIDSAKAANIYFTTDTVHNIAKNRSIDSYLRNNPAERQEYFSGKIALHKTDISKEEVESMMDQRLSTIIVKDTAGKIKGILASYAMHPTSTGDATEVYSSDVFGLASVYASQILTDHPVIAFYNGAEGDVAPNYQFHNRADAVCIASDLSESIVRISNTHKMLPLSGIVTHRTKIINIASNKVEYNLFDENCYCRLPKLMVSTSHKAMVGASVLSGASDGRTSLSSFGINDGIRSELWDPMQGYKMPAVKFLVSDVMGEVIHEPIRTIASKLIKTKPSSRVPISIHQIGEIYFVGLPGEFTTMLGRRIKKAISCQYHCAENAISLVGLADSYISYVTTPCEFNEQAYEGASDYFGISTGQVFVKEYEILARQDENKMEDRRGRSETHKAGASVSFGPSHLGDLQIWNNEEGLQNLLVSADGVKLRTHTVPAEVLAKDTILIASDEAVAYSFEDTINIISNTGNFYPTISFQTPKGCIVPVPELILTLDQYSIDRNIWTVRIPDLYWLGDSPVQITIGQLSSQPQYFSAFFRR